jgi:hypothetical protein
MLLGRALWAKAMTGASPPGRLTGPQLGCTRRNGAYNIRGWSVLRAGNLLARQDLGPYAGPRSREPPRPHQTDLTADQLSLPVKGVGIG